MVCVLVFAVRFGWLGLLAVSARKRKNLLQPTSAKEVLILTWCGMRGLATLALALALPTDARGRLAVPGPDQVLVIGMCGAACHPGAAGADAALADAGPERIRGRFGGTRRGPAAGPPCAGRPPWRR